MAWQRSHLTSHEWSRVCCDGLPPQEINYSLGCLKECIRAQFLAATRNGGGGRHGETGGQTMPRRVPYRNSKLTFLLRECWGDLGGHARGSGGGGGSCGADGDDAHPAAELLTGTGAAEAADPDAPPPSPATHPSPFQPTRTTFIAHVAPLASARAHSASTLYYARQLVEASAASGERRRFVGPERWGRPEVASWVSGLDGGRLAPWAGAVG